MNQLKESNSQTEAQTVLTSQILVCECVCACARVCVCVCVCACVCVCFRFRGCSRFYCRGRERDWSPKYLCFKHIRYIITATVVHSGISHLFTRFHIHIYMHDAYFTVLFCLQIIIVITYTCIVMHEHLALYQVLSCYILYISLHTLRILIQD